MTITLTIEELRNHEADFRTWGLKRALFAEQVLASAYSDPLGSYTRGSYLTSPGFKDRLAKWEA